MVKRVEDSVDIVRCEWNALSDNITQIDETASSELEQRDQLAAQMIGDSKNLGLPVQHSCVAHYFEGFRGNPRQCGAAVDRKHLNRFPLGQGKTGKLDRNIHALPVGSVPYLSDGITAGAVHRYGTAACSLAEFLRIDIYGIDFHRTTCACKLYGRHAETAHSNYCNAVSRTHSSPSESVKRSCRRAHHDGGSLEFHGVRNRNGILRGNDDKIGISSMGMLSYHLPAQTELLHAAHAVFALSAGDQIVQGNAVAYSHIVNTRSGLYYDSRHLVAGSYRRKSDRRSTSPIVRIGVADPCRPDADHDFSGTRDRVRYDSFLKRRTNGDNLDGFHWMDRSVTAARARAATASA
jgi:hypothetical protein